MNLLPVIYASLLIFGSLFLIVLVTSYITYKIKQYNGGAALATANTRTLNDSRTIRNNTIQKSKEKVNVIRRSNQSSKDIQKEYREPTQNIQKRVVSRLQTNQRTIQEKDEYGRRNKINSSNKNPHFARMTRIQDLRSSNTNIRKDDTHYFKPPAEYAKVSNGSILRYYEDF